jgi:integrase
MSRRKLADRTLKTLKPVFPKGHEKAGQRLDTGERYDLMDTDVPGFGVRVTAKGQRTFILAGRFPGRPHYTRRELGSCAPFSDSERKNAEKAYKALPEKEREALTFDQYMLRIYGPRTLGAAREKARRWKQLLELGKDPAAEEERIERENQRRQENTFETVAEDYIRHVVIGPDENRPKQRKGPEVGRAIRSVFVRLWGKRPITEISRYDVLAAIEGVRDFGTERMLASYGIKEKRREERQKRKRGVRQRGPAPVQARNFLAYLKTLFSWAIERGTYGLETSPCDHVRGKTITGERNSRDRILSDTELAALWRAAGRIGYPYGPLYQLLILSGLRLNEAADAVRPEFDFENRLWVIPAARMKGRNSKARPHAVPLTKDILAILEKLPRFKKGDCLFSTSFGKKPVWVNDKVKKRLDGRMLHTLRALARMRGDEPDNLKLEPWTNHDLRRTLRSGLSKLRVDADVAEAVLAHVKSGIVGVYDRYDLLEEKRQALELWGAHVRLIVTPPPENVVPLRAQA